MFQNYNENFSLPCNCQYIIRSSSISDINLTTVCTKLNLWTNRYLGRHVEPANLDHFMKPATTEYKTLRIENNVTLHTGKYCKITKEKTFSLENNMNECMEKIANVYKWTTLTLLSILVLWVASQPAIHYHCRSNKQPAWRIGRCPKFSQSQLSSTGASVRHWNTQADSCDKKLKVREATWYMNTRHFELKKGKTFSTVLFSLFSCSNSIEWSFLYQF